MKTISLKDAAVLFKDSSGLRGFLDINADFHEGEWISVLGPSGCGKSTLLRALAQLQPLTNGALQGVSQNTSSFVFQEPALLPWKTVYENVALPFCLDSYFTKISHLSSTQRKKIENVLELMKLSHSAHLYPAQLSGGMKMRVSLARAWVTQPSVLFLDEPFSALDEPVRMELGLELLKMWEQYRPTIFMVTHSITEAIWLSQRVILLKGAPGRRVLDEYIHEKKDFKASTIYYDRPFEIHSNVDIQKRAQRYYQELRQQE